MRRKIRVPNGSFKQELEAASDLTQKIYNQRLTRLYELNDIFPLDAPGLPVFPAESAFVTHVQDLGDKESKVVEETKKNEEGKKVTERKIVYSDELYQLVKTALRMTDFSLNVEVGPHQFKLAEFVPGHLWGSNIVEGPKPADVMIINKMPWDVDVRNKRCLSGEDAALLLSILNKLKVKNIDKFYVTHLVKFMPPNWKTVLKSVWIKDCLHLLHQELKIVQPKYILCLGGDASKALLGSAASVSDMEGRVEKFVYNVGFSTKDMSFCNREAKLMTVIHPKQVIRDQSASRQLENGLARFSGLIRNTYVDLSETVEHKVISSFIELHETLLMLEADETKRDNIVAVDAEWHGQHPINANSYMRTIQFAWQPKKAYGIKFHEAGGTVTPGFSDDDTNKFGVSFKAINLITAFFKGGDYTYIEGTEQKTIKFRRKRVVGHFFNADLEWLVEYGIDIQACFMVPLYDYEMKPENENKNLYKLYANEGFKAGEVVPAWYRTSFEGGADTGLMAHAIEETANYKLEILAMRYTNAPRYDRELQQWKTDYCRTQGLGNSELEGYGECPDSILLPYGMYDADVTLRLFYKFSMLLDEDYEGNNCREAFWESQIATPAVLEIHRTGILIDRDRIDFLTTKFTAARDNLENNLKKEIKWPEFNTRSTQHMREFLYGHALNGKIDKTTGKSVRLRPADAISLNLTPIFDTSKPPKPWREIQKLKKEKEHSPSTNKQILSLLAQEAKQENHTKLINQLRDYRFLDQVLKTVLRVPLIDAQTEEEVRNDEGNYEYDDGLASMCCDDGKVRTHIYQTKETGRWSSARPNLQNISKQRDPDYKRLLGDDYKYSLRSVLKASPGHVLVEADYVGAELFGMAVMSGDANMIKHATRNQLPEEHPDYYDIHSNVACFAFKLSCPPTKSGLAAIGKKHIRIVAKSVIFGIAYGRGAKAIAVAAKEQGIDITVDEAQAVINAIFEMYPLLRPFFDECQQRAVGNFVDPITREQVKERYLCNCFGRFRRFPSANNDHALAAEFQRQAMNFPIQSMIASAVSRALAYIYDYKAKQLAKGKNLFKVLLQIHDAILLEVPYEHVQHVCEYVLPTYMRNSVPLYPTKLDGIPTGDGPYYLGIEAEVMEYWGESLSNDQASKFGLPTGRGGAEGCVVNYSHGKGH